MRRSPANRTATAQDYPLTWRLPKSLARPNGHPSAATQIASWSAEQRAFCDPSFLPTPPLSHHAVASHSRDCVPAVLRLSHLGENYPIPQRVNPPRSLPAWEECPSVNFPGSVASSVVRIQTARELARRISLNPAAEHPSSPGCSAREHSVLNPRVPGWSPCALHGLSLIHI